MSQVTIIKAVDSHTGGEPTRVVISGFPYVGNGSMAERLEAFRRDHDHLRTAIVCEPRGHNAVVGALLCDPVSSDAIAGVIFFNNVGYLGMCGHGTMGLVKTLEYLGRISSGTHRIDTPVGTVEAQLHDDGSVTIANVPSYRYAKDVEVDVPGYGVVTGDVAYGGNWFFLINRHSLIVDLQNLELLIDFAVAVREALAVNTVRGAGSVEIDHIELFSPTPTADSRNFVLCPGLEYDRSPCGTGTSAKLACLYEDGKLDEGQVWSQESLIGSVFEGQVRLIEGKIVPTIRGTASITAEVELLFDPTDPYRFGITK
ncbi:MAG: 4-hydroxyproline epimerase [Pyrinomonadaceae bacterium]